MTTWNSALQTGETSDFDRGTAPTRTVHAWNGQTTACGLPGSGMIVNRGPWAEVFQDRCAECMKRTE